MVGLPFVNQPLFDHSKSRLVRFSDPNYFFNFLTDFVGFQSSHRYGRSANFPGFSSQREPEGRSCWQNRAGNLLQTLHGTGISR